jgi:hypothetical protein
MTEGAAPENAIHDAYVRANRLAIRLASKYEDAVLREARQTAQQLLDHVKANVKGDYEDFVRRVKVSEEFSLTESRQVAKTEKELRNLYLRGVSLLETIEEAEARARKRS